MEIMYSTSLCQGFTLILSTSFLLFVLCSGTCSSFKCLRINMMFPAGSFLLVRAYFYDSVIQEKCLFDWAAAFRIWLASGCCSSMTMAIYGRWVRSWISNCFGSSILSSSNSSQTGTYVFFVYFDLYDTTLILSSSVRSSGKQQQYLKQ